MSTVSFTVIGKPEPAGSKRAFRHNGTGRMVVVDANRKAKPWQVAVARAGAEAMDGGPLLSSAVELRLTFFSPRPKGHYGTGRNAGTLRSSAPSHPTGRPDVLKLARGVEDALTGVCWRDDAQIVDEHLHKHYGEPPRVEVRIAAVSA